MMRWKAGPLISTTAAIRPAWSRTTKARLVGLRCFCAKKPVSGMTILLVLADSMSAEDNDTLSRHVILYLNSRCFPKPRHRLLAPDQGQQHRHFRAAVAPRQRQAQ